MIQLTLAPRPGIRRKLVKNPLLDCLASRLAFEVSCDLPASHPLPHYDAEYGLEFT